jgi:uncharacterized protein YceH (UPF0502 family)
MMEPVLDDKEARVIGSLIEKELSTPEYYPFIERVDQCLQPEEQSRTGRCL